MSPLSKQGDARVRSDGGLARALRDSLLERITHGSQAPRGTPQPPLPERQPHNIKPLSRTNSAPQHGFANQTAKTWNKATNQQNVGSSASSPMDCIEELDLEHESRRGRRSKNESTGLSGSREKKIDELKEENSFLRASNQSLQQEVSRLQEHQFQKMHDPRIAPPEDSVIRLKLSDIQNDITRIGKRYIPARIDVFQGRTKEEIDELCNGLSVIAVDLVAGPTDMVRENMTTGQHIGRLLFTSSLSWHLHHETLINPFFFLKGKNTESDWASAFQDADQLASRDDAAATHEWRSQTLRFFLPKADSEYAIAVRNHTGISIRAAAASARRTFLNSSAAIFLGDLKLDKLEALKEDIEAVFYKAATFAMQLWSQKMMLKISSLADLTRDTFKVDSQRMQAHPRHVLDDPADRRLDGQTVQVMMHPWVGVVGITGNERVRILVKATVYLNEP